MRVSQVALAPERKWSRRDLLRRSGQAAVGVGLTGLLAACAGTSSLGPQPSSAAAPAAASASATPTPIKTVKFATAGPTVTPSIFYFAVAQGAFAKEEGLDIQTMPVGSNQTATQGAINGEFDFAIGVPNFMIGLVAQGQKLGTVNFFEYIYPTKYRIAVLKDSAYRSLADLRGKTVGVQSLGVSDYTFGQQVFKLAGVDVQWLATGDGAPTARALATGQVAAMVSYTANIGLWDAQNLVPYRIIPMPNDFPKVGGTFLSATPEYLKTRRADAVAFARAIRKACVFTVANTAAAAELYFTVFPQALPPGMSIGKAADDLAKSVAPDNPRLSPYIAGQLPGAMTAEEFNAEIGFYGFADKVKEPTIFFTNDLVAEINNFSVAEVEARAKSWVRKQ